MKKIFALSMGLATNIPYVYDIYSKIRGPGHTNDAKYCYSVWLRHLVKLYENNLNINYKTVAELGPGQTIGIGLAAMLTGADNYYALDKVSHLNYNLNNTILCELLNMFKNKEDIPHTGVYSDIKPRLTSYKFPDHILKDSVLNNTLSPERVHDISKALNNINNSNGKCQISYNCDYNNLLDLTHSSIDYIYSQAVLEHIDDLDAVFKLLYGCLKPDGFMSHEIDYKSHNLSSIWNGHWCYSDLEWKIIRGKWPYLINRQPHSQYIKIINSNGFNIVYEDKSKCHSRLTRDDLSNLSSHRFRHMIELFQ